jgi:hypothetical protein
MKRTWYDSTNIDEIHHGSCIQLLKNKLFNGENKEITRLFHHPEKPFLNFAGINEI